MGSHERLWVRHASAFSFDPNTTGQDVLYVEAALEKPALRCIALIEQVTRYAVNNHHHCERKVL